MRASATLAVYSPMSGSSSSPSTSAKKLSCSARSWAKAAALVAMAERSKEAEQRTISSMVS